MRFLTDLRMAVRALARQPGFSAVALFTLALGIGASAAVFSVLQSVLLTPLRYRNPDRLVRLQLFEPNHPDPLKRLRPFLSVPLVYALHTRQDVFTGIAAMNSYRELGADLTDGAQPQRLRQLPVALDFFDVLGVRPILGRTFGPDEPDLRIAVLSFGLWTGAFGRDSLILGKSITLDGIQYLVVGVMPPNFAPPLGHAADLWTPENVGSSPASRTDWGNHYLEVIGRLAPGMTLAQAQQRLDLFTRALSQRVGSQLEMDVRLEPLQEATVGNARATLWVLMGAVGLLLLSACVNVANLFLARGVGRRRELAVRVALGAGRRGLLTDLLVESMLLAGAGGVAGLGLGYASIRVFSALAPEGLPRASEITLNGSTLVFTAIVVVAAGIVFGILPGLRFLHHAPSLALREGSTRAGVGAKERRLQSGLVVSQVAAALILLVSAGLLIKSFVRLQHVELGFEPRNAFTFQVNLPTARYRAPDSRIAFHRQLQQRIAALPQVRASGAVDWLPLHGRYHPWGFNRLDTPDERYEIADARVVAGDYFSAAGIPLIRGRAFADGDRADAPKVAVVSRTVAANSYPGDDPIGKHMSLLGRNWEIVGVVGDVPVDPYGTVVPLVYLPHDQFADNRNWALNQVVAWRGAAADGPARIRAEVAAIDPALVVYDAKPLSDVAAEALSRQRFTLLLMGAFAGTALLLATAGLYGVISYAVRQQTHEIGVRIAVGARYTDIVALILGRALRLAGTGIALGLLAVIPLTGWLRTLLFEVPVTDPSVLAIVAAGLLAVAWAAAYVPSRRAARLDPARVIRDT